jgi:hypothetical protein
MGRQPLETGSADTSGLGQAENPEDFSCTVQPGRCVGRVIFSDPIGQWRASQVGGPGGPGEIPQDVPQRRRSLVSRGSGERRVIGGGCQVRRWRGASIPSSVFRSASLAQNEL